MNIVKIISNLFSKEKPWPVLQQEYLIKDGDRVLAKISQPYQNDQFWFSFLLVPLVTDESTLTQLYSDEFWRGKTIQFIEIESQKAVSFELAFMLNDDDELIDSLEAHPERVMLRGPYSPGTSTH